MIYLDYIIWAVIIFAIIFIMAGLVIIALKFSGKIKTNDPGATVSLTLPYLDIPLNVSGGTGVFLIVMGTIFFVIAIGIELPPPNPSLSGYVWNDEDGDSERAYEDYGIENVTIEIFYDGKNKSTKTNLNGEYIFDDLKPGGYIIEVDESTLPEGVVQTYDPDSSLDSSTAIDLGENENRNNISFGYGNIFTITTKQRKYEYGGDDWAGLKYNIIDLFGNESVPLKNDNPNKLALLLVDDDGEHQLSEGEHLDFENGYVLEVTNIDIENDQVSLKAVNNGDTVGETVLNLSQEYNTWNLKLDDVEGLEDVEVFKVHIKKISCTRSVAYMHGWLLKYPAVVFDVPIYDIFRVGQMNTLTLYCGAPPLYQNFSFGEDYAISLRSLDVEDNEVCMDFMKNGEIIDSEVFEVPKNWDHVIETTENDAIVYRIHVNDISDNPNWYPFATVTGYFLENHNYYAVNFNRTHENEIHDMKNGYKFEVDSIDVGTNEVHVNIIKDNKVVDKKILLVTEKENFLLEDIESEGYYEDAWVYRINVENILCEEKTVYIKGLWLIDYKDASTIEIGDILEDKFQIVEIGDGYLKYSNKTST
ncbi:S-layer protein domain-containing protein [Methanolobus sp. ZRKC3]|uniref:S-layer protein domain-containing protein n=1 Tax=Methanolobus sp. ZRKC3 TaxID=3125786 RepID=UPI0032538072